MSTASELRHRLDAGTCLVVPDAHDAMTAQLVEAAGFPAVYVGSFGVSSSRYGVPDQSLVSLTQILESVGLVARAVDIPVVVDLEDGGPNPLAVHHNVRAAEHAGAAAIQIEDQKPGKMIGPSEELYPVEEAVDKIKAAVAARTNPDTVIIGRSEALTLGLSVDEAVERCRAYVEAGAEVATPSRVPLEDIPAVASKIGAPSTTWGMGTIKPEEQNVAGHAMAIYAMQSTLVSFRAVHDLMAGLAQSGTALPESTFMDDLGAILDLQGATANQEIASRFPGNT